MKLFLTTCAVLLAAVAAQAHAFVIGAAVSGNGSSTTVGSTNVDGSINFYAVLSGTGTYGVGSSNNGLVADTCTIGATSSTCANGTLDMWLRFAPVTLGANVLTLQFADLDLVGVNDPSYFLESVRLYNEANTSVAYVNEASDSQVVSANHDNQTLSVGLDVTGNNIYYVRLRFVTSFVGAPRGTYTNTIERVRATMDTAVSVPEPGTLSLLGAGLLAIGFMSRRRASASK